jgi:hypothetical protein
MWLFTIYLFLIVMFAKQFWRSAQFDKNLYVSMSCFTHIYIVKYNIVGLSHSCQCILDQAACLAAMYVRIQYNLVVYSTIYDDNFIYISTENHYNKDSIETFWVSKWKQNRKKESLKKLNTSKLKMLQSVRRSKNRNYNNEKL